jgi:AbrB family looped-hinge helix DNA binding protein
MPAELEIVRILENGQVTLPAAMRERLGVKPGDLVALIETPEGVLITPHEIVATVVSDPTGETWPDEE